MTLTRVLTSSSVLALLAGPAMADLTAEDVLADQLAQMALYGLDVQAQGQSRSGATLNVASLTASANIPEEDVSLSFTMGGASFTEQGDGTVLVTYPAEIPINVQVDAPGDDDVTVDMVLRQSGMQMLASGDPSQFRYEFTGQSASIDDIRFAGLDEADEVDMQFDVSLSGLQGIMNIAAGEVRPFDVDMTIDAMTILMSVNEPGGDGTFDLNFDLTSLVASYAGAVAQQNIMNSFAETIATGNRTAGTMNHGAATYNIAFDGPEGGFSGQFGIGSGNYTFAMDESGIDYGGTQQNVTATVGGSAIPFPPMTFKMAESGGRFQIPVVPGEDEQDFALAISMIGLEVDPFLWSMIDPGGQLPQDPANLVIDTNGRLILTQDIFAPEFAEQPMTAPPGQINALTVNRINLALAGAELTGDGDLTFNNQFGIPMPVGVVNLGLTGGNTLLDTLVGMGLIPQEQAMGARMMSGMFARPGDGPDSLVSTIEMKEDGSILANGQRIK